MSLTSPKRLFHIPTMSTVMYEDVADDVKEKGYVAISHVWGNQRMYRANKFGISGVCWKIPLSNPNKISRLTNAMNHYEMEYCWFDVLCMPQDKQEEINGEIPYMGDYYSGAAMTFILSDMRHSLSMNFTEWHDIVSEVVELERDFTVAEYSHIVLNNGAFINTIRDAWFARVWTLQEAILSRKLILIYTEKSHVNLSNVLDLISCANSVCRIPKYVLDEYNKELANLANAIFMYRSGSCDLTSVLSRGMGRKCYKIHDRFYGTFGILGYKDFVVDYDVSIEELNRKVAKYAYSKGDISWMGIGRNMGMGFVQPMYENLLPVGDLWRETESNMTFEDKFLYMDVIPLGVITNCETFPTPDQRFEFDIPSFVNWIFDTFVSWGFDRDDVIYSFMGFIYISDEDDEHMAKYLDCIARDVQSDQLADELDEFTEDRRLTAVQRLSNVLEISQNMTIAKVVSDGLDEYPLVICGDANVADRVVLTKTEDGLQRILGIVCNSNRRKGICLFRPYSDELDKISSDRHKFLL